MKVKALILTLSALYTGNVLAATEGVDYEVLATPVVQLEDNKVEVAEFFGYFCPHCQNLDPILLAHTKKFASDTYFRAEHVVWNPSRDVGLARLAAAVNQSGLKYSANPLIFSAFINQGVQLHDENVAKQWISSQKSFNASKLLAAYDSFSNQAQAKQMADWTMQYNITGTPTVVVGGKYKVLFNNGYDAGMKTIDELVQQVRKEKGLPTPAKKAPLPPSKGLSFATQAK